MAGPASLPLDIWRHCIAIPHLGSVDIYCLKTTSRFFRDAMTDLRAHQPKVLPLYYFIQPWTKLAQIAWIQPDLHLTGKLRYICKDALILGHYAVLEEVYMLCPMTDARPLLRMMQAARVQARVPKAFAHISLLAEINDINRSLLALETNMKKAIERTAHTISAVNVGANFVHRQHF